MSSLPYTADIAEEIRSSVNLVNTTEFRVPASGEFVPANISLVGSRVVLRNGCNVISFQVTDDQALSIRQGLEGTMGLRPLTHDIFRDVFEDFNITILSIRIERFGEEIYYGRMFVQQGDKVLDMDVRPSDAIALSLRTKDELLINRTMLQERGTNVC